MSASEHVQMGVGLRMDKQAVAVRAQEICFIQWLVFLVPCHQAASNTLEGEDGLSEPSA